MKRKHNSLLSIAVFSSVLTVLVVFSSFMFAQNNNEKTDKTATDIVTLTSENFNEFINGNLVIVDFWAAWCYPCRLQNPILEEVNKEANGKFQIGKLNVDDHASVSRTYGITSIPTLIVFKEGKVVERLSGLQQKNQLIAVMAKHSEK
jgi:thioredoxin 1